MPFIKRTLQPFEAPDTDDVIQQRFEHGQHFREIESAHKHMIDNNNSSSAVSFPPSLRGIAGFWGAFNTNTKEKLQHGLTQHHYSSVIRTLCDRDKLLQARVVSCTSRGASSWLTTNLNKCGQHLSNDHCIMAIRQRIGAPLFQDLPHTCSCGANLDQPNQQDHVHWCPKVKAPAVTLRHNHVAATLNSIAKLAGLTTRIEFTQPTFSAVLNRMRKLRPDILMIGGSATNFVDVAVCHPTTPSRVRLGILPRDHNDKTLHAINRLEQLKTTKYSTLATQYNANFIPFACDVFGAMGPQAHVLIQWISKEASSAGLLSDSADFRRFRSTTYARLSVAIQRATAIGAVDAARRIRDSATAVSIIRDGIAAAAAATAAAATAAAR